MDKSKLLQPNLFSKTNVALFLIAAMLVGFLGARAVGSVAIFLFAVNAVRDVPPNRWFTKKWWLFGLVWVGMYAISGLWTETQGPWNDAVQTKLPFLLLPLAFAFLPVWEARDIRRYTIILSILIGAGILWSLIWLPRSQAELIDIYKHSKSIRTPVYGDHISFSVSIALTIAWLFYSLKFWRERRAKVFVILVAVLFAGYLHLLAAKTGLVALYLFLIAQVLYTFYKDWKKGLVVLSICLVSAVFAYHFIPTFREKLNLARYNIDRFKHGERDGKYSDVGRVWSYDVALKIIKDKPLLGVGAGDMMPEMSKGYARWYPDVKPEEYLIPHNQFMIVALATGVPASIAFLAWLLAPFRYLKRNRNGFFFIVAWCMLLVPLFTDTALEVQFGVFVYLFFFLIQRHMLMHDAAVTEEQTSDHL